MPLAEERCDACRPGTPPISAEQASDLVAQIDPAWEVVGGNERIVRRTRTADFAEAVTLAVRIGFVAEAEGHHPDLGIGWGRLTVELTTHAAGGLTRNDFVLAAKVDGLLGDRPAVQRGG